VPVRYRRILVVFMLFLLPPAGAAMADATSDIVAARADVERGDWKAALAPLERLTAQSPENGEFRIDLARAHYYAGDFAASEADYRRAFEWKAVDPAIAAYGAAKCDARLSRRAEMLKWLGVSVSLGLRRLEYARTDEDFASYRNDPDFRRLLGLIDAKSLSRDDGWRYDIRFLAKWIKARAYHPFKTAAADRYVSGALYSESEFDGQVQSLLAAVPKLSDREIELALFKLVASLGDGHSAVVGSRTRIEFATTFPLGFYQFDDGLYVISAAPKYADLVGARILAIDGTETTEVVKKLDPYIAHDNAEWLKTFEPQFLRHVPFLQALGIAKSDDGADFMVTMRNGSKRTVHVDADASAPDIWNMLPKPDGWAWIADASAADFQKDNGKAWWWRWEPDSGILYVQYNKVADTADETLAAFAGELSQAIAKYPVDKLVIDMRNNNGGDTYLNRPLLGAVAASKVNRPGHLYVIVGRRTFSAAMNAVSDFGRFTDAIFVGEPTGGKANAPGDENPFSLPYSGILVNLSDRYWQGGWPDDFADFRAPDIAVPNTFADYAAGRDAAMQAIGATPALSP